MATVDFGRHSEDYSTYRPGFPDSFYDRIESVLPLRGMHALDLATGPGVIALELAARGASVVGIDSAAGQIEAALQVASKRGLQDVTQFHVANAEETGLPTNSFDLVTAGQCWHWFDSVAALKEIWRLLRPKGNLVIANYSYLALHSDVVHETEELILRFNPKWTMAGQS